MGSGNGGRGAFRARNGWAWASLSCSDAGWAKSEWLSVSVIGFGLGSGIGGQANARGLAVTASDSEWRLASVTVAKFAGLAGELAPVAERDAVCGASLSAMALSCSVAKPLAREAREVAV